MRRLTRVAVAAAAIGACTAELSAQTPTPPTPRPYLQLFAKPAPAAEVPKALRDAFDKRRLDLGVSDRMRDLPSGTRCDIVVVPADPRLDPRMAIEPPDPRRFSLRLVPTERYCRGR